ncbi:MAG: hypothetical protein GEV13_22375 [Rhodospirillales bacterium]|nr:hypothetical protein [Rhodospirillales bacterium]
MQRVLLTLALVATAGVSYAQQPIPAGEPTDPQGRPLIGRNDWVRQPGDQPGPASGSGAPMNTNMATAPQMQMAPQAPQMAPMPAQTGPRQAAFKDEFGFRYDSEGNRLDARGNIISPQTR